MKTKTFALAAAAMLALTVSVGGVAAIDHVHSPSEDPSDELPNDYELSVIDHDDQLSDGQAETAAALAWEHDDVQAEFDESDAYDITVQANDGLDDVTVTISGEGDEAAGADVDLTEETVTDVLDQVISPAETETVELGETTELDDGTVNFSVSEQFSFSMEDDGETITLSEDDVELDIVVMSLVDTSIDVVDENDLLSEDETALLDDLVTNDTDVNSEVNDLFDRENETGDVEEWTLTVSEHDGDLFVPADEAGVVADLTYDGTDDAVSVYVNLEDEEIVDIAPVISIDVSDGETIDFDVETIDIVDDEETNDE